VKWVERGGSGKLVLTYERNRAVHIQNPLQSLSTIFNLLQPFSTHFNHSQPTSTHLTKIKSTSTYFNPLLPTPPIYQPLFTHETNNPLKLNFDGGYRGWLAWGRGFVVRK